MSRHFRVVHDVFRRQQASLRAVSPFQVGNARDVCPCHRDCCFCASAARFRVLGDCRNRVGDRIQAYFPLARRRADDEHAAAGAVHGAACDASRHCARLADGAQRPAVCETVVCTLRCAARHSGLRAFLCLDRHVAGFPRVAGRYRDFGHRLFSVSLSADFGSAQASRSGARRSGIFARPFRWRCFPPRGAAAVAPVHPGRRVAGRAASSGGIRPLCDDPLRHVHHGDRRPVPVNL